MKPRVGSDLERGTERLARGPGLTAISTRVDPRFPKPAIVAKERERRCVEGYLRVDGDGSRNGYVLPESGISRVRSFRSYARSFGFSLTVPYILFLRFVPFGFVQRRWASKCFSIPWSFHGRFMG